MIDALLSGHVGRDHRRRRRARRGFTSRRHDRAHPGTYLFTIGDVLFLTGPVVTWMIFRGHGWRHSLEMALAMLAPVAVIMVVGQLAGYAYLLSLVTAMYPAMCLGMLAYMLTAVATSRDGWATLPRAHPPRMRSLEDGSPINDAPAAPG